MKAEENKKVTQIILMIVCIVAIIMMWGMDIVRIIDYKIPNEIREGANVALADAFARGDNPFRNLTTQMKTPDVYYMYPFLNSLLTGIIVRLTTIPAGLVLLLLNFIYTTLTAAIIAKIVKYDTDNNYLALLAFLMSHYSGWRYTNVSAFPDMFAVLLLAIIMYLCMTRSGKNKKKQIILLSILTVLGFYTKQYAIIVGLPVAIYLWIKENRKKCFAYIGVTALIGIVSAVIIYFTMPFYFVETLLLVGNSAGNDFRWAITQFIKIGKIFFPWFLIIMTWLIFEWRKKGEVDYVFINFFSMAVMLVYFGQNTGAHLSYHLQLWLPAVIILGMRAWNWIINLITVKYQKQSIVVAFEILIFFCAISPYYRFHTPMLSQEQKINWKKLYEITDQSEKILATSQNANYAVFKHKYLYDYGQNQYILRNETREFWNDLEDSKLIVSLFPETLQLKQIHEEYRQDILKRLEKKEYDTLLLVDNFGFTRDWKEFHVLRNENYELMEKIPIETGVWKWQVGVWERK